MVEGDGVSLSGECRWKSDNCLQEENNDLERSNVVIITTYYYYLLVG